MVRATFAAGYRNSTILLSKYIGMEHMYVSAGVVTNHGECVFNSLHLQLQNKKICSELKQAVSEKLILQGN